MNKDVFVGRATFVGKSLLKSELLLESAAAMAAINVELLEREHFI